MLKKAHTLHEQLNNNDFQEPKKLKTPIQKTPSQRQNDDIDKINQSQKDEINQIFLQRASSKNQRTKMQEKFLPKFEWQLQIANFSQDENIIITDKQQLLQKINNMIKDGHDQLQIISDFDQTVTPFQHNDKWSPSTLGAVRICDDTPECLKKELEKNFNYYYPIEQDPTLENEKKVQYMEEWNRKVGEAFMSSGITGEIFDKCVQKANFAVRHLFNEFFDICKEINLPYFYVSGGINVFVHTILDSITEIDEYANLYINSQRIVLDDEKKLSKMHMDVCTSSKHEILNRKVYDFKKNTILLGDSNHDILMGGNTGAENQISILFLNERLVGNIQDFQEDGWDIIIRDPNGQGSYLIVLQILKLLGISENSQQKHKESLEMHQKVFETSENYKEIYELLKQLL